VGGGTIGSLPAIAVGGVFLWTLVYGGTLSARERRMAIIGFIGFAAAAAWLLRPLYGIRKNPATLSWCLWSIAITAAAWVVFHWFVDIRNQERPLRPFRLLGTNPLFAYILAPLFYSAFEIAGLNYKSLGQMGFTTGLARSVLFTLLVTGTAAWAARGGLRLKL
jgi:predicted acyltransferase